MAMTYQDYINMNLGSFFDPEQEKQAIIQNVQDPVQRAAILADFEGRTTYGTNLMGGVVPSVSSPSSFMQAAGQTPPMTIPTVTYPQRPIDPLFGRPIMSPSATPTPSQLASQESGAIGAASIASQMGVKPSTGSFAKAAINRPKPYTVRRGDTLSQIAQKNKMSLSQLMKLNPKFKQQAKYQGGRTIFSGTKVNLAPKPTPKKKTVTSFSPAQFRMAEERSMQQPTPIVPNPLQSNQGGFR